MFSLSRMISSSTPPWRSYLDVEYTWNSSDCITVALHVPFFLEYISKTFRRHLEGCVVLKGCAISCSCWMISNSITMEVNFGCWRHFNLHFLRSTYLGLLGNIGKSLLSCELKAWAIPSYRHLQLNDPELYASIGVILACWMHATTECVFVWVLHHSM